MTSPGFGTLQVAYCSACYFDGAAHVLIRFLRLPGLHQCPGIPVHLFQGYLPCEEMASRTNLVCPENKHTSDLLQCSLQVGGRGHHRWEEVDLISFRLLKDATRPTTCWPDPAMLEEMIKWFYLPAGQGDLYSWGADPAGQTSATDFSTDRVPRRVLVRVSFIFCGRESLITH